MSRPRDRLGRQLPSGSADERRYGEPARAITSFADGVTKAGELFDEGRFFEAHEFYEHLWKSPDARPSDRDFWRALAQVAVGCCHLQRGNPKGALTLLERAVAGLGPYPTPHHGIATGVLAGRAAETARRLRAGEPLGAIPPPRLPREGES
ncbi:MAG TPA: DUF309 domain-containing protein [Myxococcaceae bacterium]|nr:DUF309 domain-containing protein [Myxococcaceae bacterium]